MRLLKEKQNNVGYKPNPANDAHGNNAAGQEPAITTKKARDARHKTRLNRDR